MQVTWATLRMSSLACVCRLPANLKESLIWLVSRDLSASAFFCRRFWWTDMNMWPEDLPQGRTLLVGRV